MIFVIYSCQKYRERARVLYEMVKGLDGCRVFILYGDPTIESEYVIKDPCIIVRCGDSYEHLHEKTRALCRVIHMAFPEEEGVFKCDDDIFPNVWKINELIRWIQKESVDYLGRSLCITGDSWDDHHIGKCKVQHAVLKRACTYAAGPFYYLSRRSLEIIQGIDNIGDYFIEDNMVGYVLNRSGIYPIDKMVYSDRFEDCHKGCVHNVLCRPYLYVSLSGDLVNQWAQYAVGFKLAVTSFMGFLLVIVLPREEGEDKGEDKGICEMLPGVPVITADKVPSSVLQFNHIVHYVDTWLK